MSNAATERGALEGGPRYGDVWSRTLAHASDVGHGAIYAEFDTRAEFLAVVQHNGESTARLYSVNPTTGVYTAIDHNGSTALNASGWQFVQYGDRIYGLNQTDGFWTRRIGGPDGTSGDPTYDLDDTWKRFRPEILRSTTAEVTLTKPPYADYVWPAGTACYWSHLAGEVDQGHDVKVRQAINASNEVEVYSETNPMGYPTLYAKFVIDFPAPVDFRKTGYIEVEVSATCIVPIYLYSVVLGLTETGSGPLADNYVPTSLRVCLASITTVDGLNWRLRWDIDESFSQAWSRAGLDSVVRLEFQMTLSYSHSFEMKWKKWRLGGRLLEGSIDEPEKAPEISYAYSYFNPTTGQYYPAVTSKLAAGQAAGQKDRFDKAMGAVVTVTPATSSILNSQGYTQIKVFRKTVRVALEPEVWKVLTTLTNSGSPSFVDATTRAELFELTNAPDALSFESILSLMSANGIAVWKQHLILMSGVYVLMSEAGLPGRFFPAAEDLTSVPEATEDTAPRTLVMAQAQTDAALTAVAQDVLYLFGSRGSYAMIGDLAATSTPSRLLPGSRGAAAAMAVCRFETGAAMAARDGLWYLEAARALTNSIDAQYEKVEMTKEVRDSWADFYGTGGTKIVLAEFDDELWAFNETKFLRLTRRGLDDRRTWQEGTMKSVKALLPHQSAWLRAFFSDGKIGRLIRNDAGAAYTTDAGGTATFWAESGRILIPRSRVMGIEIECDGTPTVKVTMDDRAKTAGVDTTDTYVVDAYRRHILKVKETPGSAVTVRVEGQTGRDTVKFLALTLENVEGKAT